jgi:glycosyltransferase involved in cell wall biosynthesis
LKKHHLSHGVPPKNSLELRLHIRQLRIAGQEAGIPALIDDFVAAMPATIETQIFKAGLLHDGGLIDKSESLFVALLAEDPAAVKVRSLFVRLSLNSGRVARAVAYAPGLEIGDAAAQKLGQNVERMSAALSRFAPEGLLPGKNARTSIVVAAIDRFANRTPRAVAPDRVGPIALMTRTLGPGGAELQFSLLTRQLHQRIGQPCEAHPEVIFDGPVHVVSLLPLEESNGFHLPILTGTGLTASSVDELKRHRGPAPSVLGPDFDTLTPLLPPLLRNANERLAPWLAKVRPDVFGIWQDDTIVFATLAALIAEVPRIQLNLRGESPPARKSDICNEFRDWYLAMAAVPGIEFQCNAHRSAETYVDWLSLPLERFEVIPNGSEQASRNATEAEQQLWANFDAGTKGASRTIGTTGRLHPCKRVNLWLNFAARYLDRHPDARFVIVGGGPQEALLRARAAELGLADRLLFTGLTPNVGFWLDRMDLFLTLSESEGMPNALMEAQVSGLPIVSTQAGDSVTCYIEGQTGASISDLDNPDLTEVMDLVDGLVYRFNADPALTARAAAHGSTFSVDRMGASYMASTCKPAKTPGTSV